MMEDVEKGLARIALFDHIDRASVRITGLGGLTNINYKIETAQDEALLHIYFADEPPAFAAGRMVMYKALCGLLWSLWGTIQDADGNPPQKISPPMPSIVSIVAAGRWLTRIFRAVSTPLGRDNEPIGQ